MKWCIVVTAGKFDPTRNNARDRSVRFSVTIVDSGPFVKGRIIDLSAGAASRIGPADLMRVEIVPD